MLTLPTHPPRRRLNWIAGAFLGTSATGILFAGIFGPHAPRQPLPKDLIVDMHCHAAGIGAGESGCFVSPAMQTSFKFGQYLKSFGVSRAELNRRGDALLVSRLSQRLAESRYVGKAVVLALDGVVDSAGRLDRDHTEVYVPNEYLALEVAKYPNLLFGASVNPSRPDALARLTWAKEHGAVLVKWLPAIQHIDPADERLIPFYQKLLELKLPLLTHTGPEHSFTRSADDYGDPEKLRLPLRLGVTIIAAHASTGNGTINGERPIERLARLMELYPNLYADVSSLTQVNKSRFLKEVLTRPEFKQRLLYGTDYPLTAIPLLVSPWYNPFHLSVRQMFRISRNRNPWDRDVELKHALGLPADVWTRSETVLQLEGRPTRSGNSVVDTR